MVWFLEIAYLVRAVKGRVREKKKKPVIKYTVDHVFQLYFLSYFFECFRLCSVQYWLTEPLSKTQLYKFKIT